MTWVQTPRTSQCVPDGKWEAESGEWPAVHWWYIVVKQQRDRTSDTVNGEDPAPHCPLRSSSDLCIHRWPSIICPHLNTHETHRQTDTSTPLGLNIGWYYRAHRITCVIGFAEPSEGWRRDHSLESTNRFHIGRGLSKPFSFCYILFRLWFGRDKLE